MERIMNHSLEQLCMRNGELISAADAVLPVTNTELEYGFGVYETIRIENGIAYFTAQHIDRLLYSANHIGLEHAFTKQQITEQLNTFITQAIAVAQTCNIKILFLGAADPADTQLYFFASAPLFVDRKLYKTGCHTMTHTYERPFPQAKTLAMLGSYLAYREAKKVGAYDALLLNRNNEITEGTRTNFFAIKGKTLYHPPQKDILEGVTKLVLQDIAIQHGWSIVEHEILYSEISSYDGAFLTSTSTKVLPIKSINDFSFETIAPGVLELSVLYREYWTHSQGVHSSAS